jgi:hypothetical protein
MVRRSRREGNMSTSFEGHVVIVTGANSGIGEAAAVAFQETGAMWAERDYVVSTPFIIPRATGEIR